MYRPQDDRTGRIADMADIERRMSRTSDSAERKRLESAARDIRNEPRRVQAMREELVKAVRNGDQDRIKEIHSDRDSYTNPFAGL